MRRPPLLATLLVALACATMIGLGVWQLRRAEWKAAMIGEMRRPAANPRVTLACTLDAPPRIIAGRNRAGESGYHYLAPCTLPGAAPVTIDAGWSRRPDALARLAAPGPFTGVRPTWGARILVLDRALPPLEPSARPTPDDIPDNHIAYAIQWFAFAAAALIIYALALRRRPSPQNRLP